MYLLTNIHLVFLEEVNMESRQVNGDLEWGNTVKYFSINLQ